MNRGKQMLAANFSVTPLSSARPLCCRMSHGSPALAFGDNENHLLWDHLWRSATPWRAPPERLAQSTTQPAQVASWSFSAVAYTYIVPHSRSYVQPTITADREWLHLEARYNYEDLETGSLWVGYNFSIGDKISLNITPMFGGVFGKTNGIAPGLR